MHIDTMLLPLKWNCHGEELSQEDRNRIASALAGGDQKRSPSKAKSKREYNVLAFTPNSARHEELA
jgi:hypothetical protein